METGCTPRALRISYVKRAYVRKVIKQITSNLLQNLNFVVEKSICLGILSLY